MLKYALPTNPDKSVQFNFSPGFLATKVVALGLLSISVASLIFALNPSRALGLILTGIAFLFILRGVGDFKYVGLFKKVKGTLFSEKDTQIFIPLCFWLGFSLLIAIYL